MLVRQTGATSEWPIRPADCRVGRFQLSLTPKPLLMTRVHSRDFLAGLVFVASGGLGLALGADFLVGTSARMGPGYLPMLLCWGLIGVGAVLIGRVFVMASETMDAWSWRPLTLVTLSLALFGVLIEKAGLAIALTLLIGVGAYAGRDSRWKEVAVLAIGLVLFSIAAFIWGLGLPLRVLPR